MLRFVLAVVYFSSVTVIPPDLAAGSPKKDSKEVSLKEFVARLEKEGELNQFPRPLARLLGFPEDVGTKKGFRVPETDSVDGASRVADIVLVKPADSEDSRPFGLYWSTTVKTDRTYNSYTYHSSLDGTLLNANRVFDEPSEGDKMIRGKSKLTHLDVDSDEVRDRFQREVLDFWLKGKGRKKAGAKPSAARKSNRKAGG
ncbi:MAG: hypothetical protein HY554_00055 [Elusimicrobia bacterium]|nr:hypothetical protein [Elusimicrobiota bacterium]